MANKYSETETTSESSPSINQRQLSDPRTLTTCYLLFENANGNEIRFIDYYGTHSRTNRTPKLFLPQVINTDQMTYDDPPNDFANYIQRVLKEIPSNELTSYTVTIRTGVLYFFSRSFRFRGKYTLDLIQDILQKKIPTSDEQFFFPPRNNTTYQVDGSLRSSFCNVKPVSDPKKLVDKLHNYQFYVKEQKHVFRIYLQSEDKQTHVCIVDPGANYSIIEFSKDFQRTSNIDFIRDRRSSKYRRSQSYDDIFDYRIQFQHNPRTCNDQSDTIINELRQQFPSLDENFSNENILTPLEHDEKELHISLQLCPYVNFIRRDFGDVYHYNGDDQLFENFTIYLESSVEYSIDRKQGICKPILDTHGLVYAKLDLSTMASSETIDEKLLIHKLWDMGTGLTSIAGECTTSETQQSTNYYTSTGEMYTAEDEALVQRILSRPQLCPMLGLPHYAKNYQITEEYERINKQLDSKWHSIRSGSNARDKLRDSYEQFFNEQY